MTLPKKSLAVALVCDERLAAQAGAVAFKINTDWKFDVHIFVETNSNEVKRFHRVETDGITYHVNKILNEYRNILPKMDRYPVAVWGRILLPEVLSEYARILYLDVDILPGPKPHDIEKISLPNGIGMVSNYWTRYFDRIGHRRTIEHMEYLGLEAKDYFNAGVILMEPSKLKEQELGQSLTNFVSHFGDKIKSADQDFLSYHYKGKITKLSANLNFIQPLMGFGFERKSVPSVRHYVMQPKLYEKLYNFGATSIIKSAQSEFLELLENAQLPKALLTPQQKLKFFRRAKNALRRVIAPTFLGKSRQKREYQKWQQMRSVIFDMLQHDEAHCADRFPFRLAEKEPKIHWTGTEFICIDDLE